LNTKFEVEIEADTS